jgi:hypothetical protein
MPPVRRPVRDHRTCRQAVPPVPRSAETGRAPAYRKTFAGPLARYQLLNPLILAGKSTPEIAVMAPRPPLLGMPLQLVACGRGRQALSIHSQAQGRHEQFTKFRHLEMR